ncbi:MAG TPA: hypothetical protein VMS31_12745 [Pyrinomonadaceae bacterium]|nr:hypothetical protein [Pyrinomonadaceae bacterium]
MSERKTDDLVFELKVVGAALSFLGAIVTGLGGILLTTSCVVVPTLHPHLRALGIGLLMVAFPLLICGGHCLDLMVPSENPTPQHPLRRAGRQWSRHF